MTFLTSHFISVVFQKTTEDSDVEYDNKSDEKDVDVFENASPVASSVTDENEKSKVSDDFDDDEGLLPIETSTKEPTEPELEHISIASTGSEEAHEDDNDEGSADETTSSVQAPIDYDEGSGDGGSGGSPIFNFDSSTLGIFSEDVTTEAPLVIGTQKSQMNQNEDAAEGGVDSALGVDKAGTSNENKGTYILLAAIGILLVSLIAFVAVQNRKEKRNKNKRTYDVEKEGRNGGTELQDMDKSLLGKPIEKNGNGKHENSPLIGNYEPPAITVNEPIQELPQKDKSQQSLYENNLPNGNGSAFEPIEPVHATPLNGGVTKTPDSDEEVFHPANDNLNGPESLNVSPEPPKRYSPIYSPTSPRSARYSPVYSPETGRVKIKLTETPKPKTPVVVTRSRSRAGDYVNTPNN